MEITNNDALGDTGANPAGDTAGQGAEQDSSAQTIAGLKASLADSEAAKASAIDSRNAWKAKAQGKAGDTAEGSGAGDTAPDMTQLLAKFDAQEQRFEQLEAKLTAQQSDLARDGATAKLLEGVAHGSIDTAKLMLAGLEAGGIDITSRDGAATARDRLTNTPSLFVDNDRGTQHRALQRGPGGKLNFDGLNIDQIPPEHHAEAFADAKTRERLLGGGSAVERRRTSI